MPPGYDCRGGPLKTEAVCENFSHSFQCSKVDKRGVRSMQSRVRPKPREVCFPLPTCRRRKYFHVTPLFSCRSANNIPCVPRLPSFHHPPSLLPPPPLPFPSLPPFAVPIVITTKSQRRGAHWLSYYCSKREILADKEGRTGPRSTPDKWASQLRGLGTNQPEPSRCSVLTSRALG